MITVEYNTNTHSERSEAHRAVDALRADSSMDSLVLALEARTLAPYILEYRAQRTSFLQADANWKVKLASAKDQRDKFLRFHRRFSKGILDSQGRSTAGVQATMMGGTLPGYVSRLKRSDLLEVMTRLATQLPLRSDLDLDPDALSRFITHLDALSSAFGALDTAESLRAQASQAQTEAVKAVDSAYMDFVVMLRRLLGVETLQLLLPRFSRGTHSDRSDEDEDRDVDSSLNDAPDSSSEGDDSADEGAMVG